MDEEYDVVMLGTGFKECVLSGLLSVAGKKVLHMDKNNYYGGASASLNLNQLFEAYKKGEKPPATLGASKEYNVDIIPKFIMASGDLVRLLVHTDVAKYLDFKVVDGSFVYKGGKISKVPCTATEALSSPLMGFFEKRSLQKFLTFTHEYNPSDPSTHQGFPDLTKVTMDTLYKKFGLGQDTIDFLGHAVALYQDDDYIQAPAKETVERMNLYADSLSRYTKSPYLYPMYGLGELPQGFARLSAIYGGTYMLDKKVDEIVYKDGQVVGVRSGTEVVKCKQVVGDPSYFPDKVRKTGRVARIINILNAPIPNTDNSESCQIILPQNQVKRKSDIYISCVSAAHNVCPKGKFVAIVSSRLETEDPIRELDVALKLLGPIAYQFVTVNDTFEPLESKPSDNFFVSSSYDSTSHFETATEDIKGMYKRITGKDVDLTAKPRTEAPEHTNN